MLLSVSDSGGQVAFGSLGSISSAVVYLKVESFRGSLTQLLKNSHSIIRLFETILDIVGTLTPLGNLRKTSLIGCGLPLPLFDHCAKNPRVTFNSTSHQVQV